MKKFLCLCLSLTITFTIFATAFVVVYGEPDDNSTILTNIQDLFKDKRYSKCIAECDKLLEKDETIMDAYYFKASSYYYSNDYQKGYDTLTKQLSLNPKNELALYNGACAASLMNNEKESLDLLGQLFKLNINEKSSIMNDKDFDNIRNSQGYKKLMGISVVVGGELLEFDVPPIVVEGRTLLPLRKVFEALDAEVSFVEETQTVEAKKDDLTLSLVIGSKVATVNGVEKELDVPAMIQNDRTLVPIRFVGESLNAKVDWDEENQNINILTSAPEGNAEYIAAKAQMDAVAAISVVDGGWPEPYHMPITEGASLIIFKDIKGLDAFNSLSAENRSKYVNETVYNNFALVLGCNPVHAKVIFDSKAYYEGDFVYDKKDQTMALTYYKNGKPVNVVIQYKDTFNYKDFYLLPAAEQITSTVEE